MDMSKALLPLQRRHRLHLEQHAVERQPRHRDQRAGGLGPGAEGTRQFFAEHVQPLLVVVDDQRGELQHVACVGAGCLECGAQVVQGLSHLRAEVGGQLAALVLAALARDESEARAGLEHRQMRIAVGCGVVEPGWVGEGEGGGRGVCCGGHEVALWV